VVFGITGETPVVFALTFDDGLRVAPDAGNACALERTLLDFLLVVHVVNLAPLLLGLQVFGRDQFLPDRGCHNQVAFRMAWTTGLHDFQGLSGDFVNKLVNPTGLADPVSTTFCEEFRLREFLPAHRTLGACVCLRQVGEVAASGHSEFVNFVDLCKNLVTVPLVLDQ